MGTSLSKRKLRAMRVGKPAGTGPTSAAGKARSAQNARKHGLNVPVMHDPDVGADVEFMAEEIAPGCQDPELIGRARRIAEAQVDLIRIARARRDIISAAMADPHFGPVAGVTGRIAYSPPPCGEGSGVGVGRGGTSVPRGTTPHPDPPPQGGREKELHDPGADKLVTILSDIGARLARLDRYERGALLRRKRAVRVFDAARRRASRRQPAKVTKYRTSAVGADFAETN